jgi:hypothetical protein
VRYTRILAQNDLVKETLNVGPLPMREAIMDQINLNVIPGTLFVRDGSLLEVILVNEDNVTVRDDSFNEYVIRLDEAAHLIDDYLN